MAWIYGTRGNDRLGGGSGNDLFWGNAGNDTLFGGGGNDTFYDGAGADTYYGDTNLNLTYGGVGSDTVSYANASSGLTANLISGTGKINGETDTFHSIE